MPPSRFENLERVAWAGSREFHHEPELADYQYFFAQPEWQQTLNGLSKSGISNIIVASGSGFRNHGSRALGTELGVRCLSVGKVDDELDYGQYQKHHNDDDVIEYQREISGGKFHREEVRANGLLTKKSLLIAMDEIILIWQEGNLVPMEKPVTREEAIDQIMALTLGQKFIVSNSTSVGTAESIRTGRAGVAVHLLPMQISCKNQSERNELINASIDLYERGRRGDIKLKQTPGAFTLLHPLRQPYQQVLINGALEKGVLPWGFTREEYLRYKGEDEHRRKIKPNRAYVQFAQSLLGRELLGTPFLDLPADLREEVGITIGGLSMVGLREACERYLAMQGWSTARNWEQRWDIEEVPAPIVRGLQMKAMLVITDE